MIKKFLLSFFLVSSAFSQTALEYLNNNRTNAGMIPFSQNSYLDISAYNHANYMMFNMDIGHTENNLNQGFTGINPWDRAQAVGYNGQASENLTAGYFSYESSIDGLFSAIYHRLGFLSFEDNEIGIGMKANSDNTVESRVYNMGNSNLVNLCNGISFDGYGTYYYDICIDPNFKIQDIPFFNAFKDVKKLNPESVVWPYENQSDTDPVFFEESPDPLPTCSVSGYPVSIQFNDSLNSDVFLNSFKLFDMNNVEVTDVTLMDQSTDHTGHFTKDDFALFPMKRLDWNNKYTAKFNYTQNGTIKEKVWSFTTKSLAHPYYVANEMNHTFNLKSGKTYAIYAPPVDCNDSRTNFNYTYTVDVAPEMDWIDSNTVYIKLTGSVGQSVTATLDNGKIITLNIASNDSATLPNSNTDVDNDGIPDEIDLDNDNDGMSDEYETENGLNPLIDDSTLDLDGDGRTNIEEFNEGTNANDANSRMFTFNLNQGWNLVSLELNSLVDLNALYNNSIEIIRSLQDDTWKVWTKTNISTSEASLTTLEDGYGYWIKVSQNTSLDILGDGVPDVKSIVENKWQMLGSRNIDDINQFFIDNTNVKVIWKYTQGVWSAVSIDSGISSDLVNQNIPLLNTVSRGEGIFLK